MHLSIYYTLIQPEQYILTSPIKILFIFILFICGLCSQSSSIVAQSQPLDSLSANDEIPTIVDQAEISSHLQKQIDAQENNISSLAILVDQLDAATIINQNNLKQAPVLQRRQVLYSKLTDHATRTQATLRAWLDEQGIQYRPYYIMNMLEIQADSNKINAVSLRPEVARMVANPPVRNQHAILDNRLYSAVDEQGYSELNTEFSWLTALELPEAQSQSAYPYGLVLTGATQVWEMGFTGEGIVVASQDTGVEWEHAALQSRYRGWQQAMITTTDTITNTEAITVDHTYHWFDAWGATDRPANRCDVENYDIPCDDQGHGTHTVGTILGNEIDNEAAVGMAPDAQWIGCRNMRNGFGTPGSYAACFEFFMAPYPQYGDPFVDGQPELAPHIINNSWGCPPEEGCDAESLRTVVETIRAAGIFVVSSAGNSGSLCRTVQHPIAIHDATFSIGAHDRNGNIAAFSSRGPVTADGSGRMKPDLSAPGVSVYSTYINNRYSILQGTSMASPHVAGAIALLWSAEPSLIGQIDLTEQVLAQTADPVLSNDCGEASQPVAPNNTYGYGKLNILAAVEQMQQTHDIQVLNCEGQPLTGAEVTLTNDNTDFTISRLSDDEGNATFPALHAYQSANLVNVVVSAKNIEFEPRSFALASNVQSSDSTCQYSLTMTPTCYQAASLELQVNNIWSRPVSNATVGLLDKSSGCREEVQTNNNGIARFTSLFQGDYQIQIDAKGQGALFETSEFSLENSEAKVLTQDATHSITYYPIFFETRNVEE